MPVEVSLPHTKYALPAYYIVAPAECSSNLARFDGIRYGPVADADNLLDQYEETRGRLFGPEVKRRIMLGTFALASGYYDQYYGRAQRVRTLIVREFAEAFEQVMGQAILDGKLEAAATLRATAHAQQLTAEQAHALFTELSAQPLALIDILGGGRNALTAANFGSGSGFCCNSAMHRWRAANSPSVKSRNAVSACNRSPSSSVSSSTSSLRIWPPVLQPMTWALANIARSSWVRAPLASAERTPKYRTRSASA